MVLAALTQHFLQFPVVPQLNPVPTILPQYKKSALTGPVLETRRLRLRRWEARDVVPFVALCRDPQVMQFFNGLLSPADCFEEIERQEINFDAYGYGLWAVELKTTGEFIGSIGIEPTMMKPQGMTARITWKLCRAVWGMNYAYEAGLEVLAYAFGTLGVRDAFAHVDPYNVRSLKLIQRLGFVKHPQDSTSFFKSAP